MIFLNFITAIFIAVSLCSASLASKIRDNFPSKVADYHEMSMNMIGLYSAYIVVAIAGVWLEYLITECYSTECLYRVVIGYASLAVNYGIYNKLMKVELND